MQILKILGHDFELIADPDLEKRSKAGGLAAISQNKIFYMSTYALSQQRDVILHECIEIINSCNDLKLAHNKIQILACSLQQLLSDNPMLLELFKPDNDKTKTLPDQA